MLELWQKKNTAAAASVRAAHQAGHSLPKLTSQRISDEDKIKRSDPPNVCVFMDLCGPFLGQNNTPVIS